MSTAMIMRPYSNLPSTRREGLGDPVTDAANALLAPLTQQMNAKIDQTKIDVMAEVDKQATQAKIYAVAGGFAAGLLGAFLYNRFVR